MLVHGTAWVQLGVVKPFTKPFDSRLRGATTRRILKLVGSESQLTGYVLILNARASHFSLLLRSVAHKAE